MTHDALSERGFGRVEAAPITVFIVSWGRPLYLWACLDSLYRLTRSPVRFVLLDNAHPDPMVGDVIAGFQRRGLFAEVIRFETNSFANITEAYADRLGDVGPLHVYMESDCVIQTGANCWLTEMRRIMEAHPTIGMLGSLINPTDFVARETAVKVTGGDAAAAEFLAKLQSPERAFAADHSWAATAEDYFVTAPPCPIINPPGRLMMLRTDVMQRLGFHVDGQLAGLIRDQGLEPAVTPRVRHRHLSLLNVFDYLDYDRHGRDDFFVTPPVDNG